MVTQAEEQQAKEFLKRAEVRTMRKDLQGLREVDALKERDKIATIKTLEEQLSEHKKDLAKEASAQAEKIGRQDVLEKHESEERIAEKDLKNYGSEEERQKIFLLESQRLGFEKQIDVIDKEKDPALKMQKNDLLLKIRGEQNKLNSIIEEEKKFEGEEKAINDKAQTTTAVAERKALEQSKWDLEERIKGIEKKRWGVEKQIEDLNKKIDEIDKLSDQLVIEKNGLKDKALGIDKQLREVYSVVIAREEEKRRGQSAEQMAQREAATKARAEKNEQVQREQWSGIAAKRQVREEGYLSKAPEPVKRKIMASAVSEEEQRKKFLQDVTSWSETGGQTLEGSGKQQQKSAEPSVLKERSASTAPQPPLPPVPHKK